MNTITEADRHKISKMASTRYHSKDTFKDSTLMRSSFDNFNIQSTRENMKKFHPLRKSDQFSGSYELLNNDAPNLPEILIPSQIDNVLKKTNQRLLKNVDKGRLKKVMRRNKQSLEMIKKKKINSSSIKQYQDYNIRESSEPKKHNYLTIPQKPSKVYDCIKNISKHVQPPDIQMENYSSYRDNYYKAINSRDKPFNKHMGYFSYFSEKTKREREMNTLYSRKNLTKFANKMRDNSEERREKVARLNENFFTPLKDNHRFGSRKMSESNKTFRASNSTENFDNKQYTNYQVQRRASNTDV